MRTERQTSIDVALNLLELFSAEKIELGLSEMARLLGKKARGYIEQDLGRGKYHLGLKAFELGCVYQNQSNVMKEATQPLERLARETNETTNLAVLDQGLKEIASSAKIDSRIGTKLHAHCTALGKVLLASLDPPIVLKLFPPHKKLPAQPPHSIIDTDTLHRQLPMIRTQGFALDAEEYRSEVV